MKLGACLGCCFVAQKDNPVLKSGKTTYKYAEQLKRVAESQLIIFCKSNLGTDKGCNTLYVRVRTRCQGKDRSAWSIRPSAVGASIWSSTLACCFEYNKMSFSLSARPPATAPPPRRSKGDWNIGCFAKDHANSSSTFLDVSHVGTASEHVGVRQILQNQTDMIIDSRSVRLGQSVSCLCIYHPVWGWVFVTAAPSPKT